MTNTAALDVEHRGINLGGTLPWEPVEIQRSPIGLSRLGGGSLSPLSEQQFPAVQELASAQYPTSSAGC